MTMRIVLLLSLCVGAVSLIASEATNAPQRYPPTFEEYSPGMVADVYESFRLQMNLREQTNAPIAFEAEHASVIGLHGAERIAFVDDAAGGVAVWQAQTLGFNFETLAPATNTPIRP